MNAMAALAAQENLRLGTSGGELHAQHIASVHAERAGQVARGGHLIREFARKKGVKISELLGRNDKRLGRGGELHVLRSECWAMLRDKTGLSYPQIGRMFSGRDHSTIRYGEMKHRAGELQA